MRSRGMRVLDAAKLRDVTRGPNTDTRNFVEEGTVSDDENAVTFDEAGPLVIVNLQPSKLSLPCRVLQQMAGKGEGEWNPFVAGDHVLVVFPHGDPWAGAIIIGRMTNELDAFPSGSVAGQDPQQNGFAFRRQRTPFTHEIAGTYTVREATSGSFLNIDSGTGTITLKNGTNDALQMSADMFGFQSGDAKFLMQIDQSAKRFMLQVNDALLQLSSSDASPNDSGITTPGSFSISALSQPAIEHVLTTEALFNILSWFFKALGTANPGPLLGAVLGGAADGILATAATTAAVGPLNPAIAVALQGAFALAQKKPPGVPGQGQLMPGIGSAGVVVG